MANTNTIYVAPPALAGGGTGWATTETAIKLASATTKPCVAYVPGSNRMKGKAFRVRAVGHVTGGTTTNFTAKLYYGTSATLASDTAIATSGAVAVDSASHNFELVADLVWDATSKAMQGTFHGEVANTAVSRAALSNAVANADPATEGQGFLVSGQFSASNANNAVVLDELVIEQA